VTSKPRQLRIAVTGASGLLGRTLAPLLATHGHLVIFGHHQSIADAVGSLMSLELDLLDQDSIIGFVEQAEADCIVHSAALTDVDRCEREPELADAANTQSVRYLTEAITRLGGRLILLSSDYVFDGADGPYDEDATPNPVNVYGRTKLAAERIVESAGVDAAIVRSASFLGGGTAGRPTWIEKMAETMIHRPPLSAPFDQYSNITPIRFLAAAIIAIVEGGLSGLRHIAGEDILSRFEFALMLAQSLGLSNEAVRPVPYRELGRAAQRPLNGGLLSRHSIPIPQIELPSALAEWKSKYLRSRT
jgi:dTDP-4-dehydrorhamnose reductase